MALTFSWAPIFQSNSSGSIPVVKVSKGISIESPGSKFDTNEAFNSQLLKTYCSRFEELKSITEGAKFVYNFAAIAENLVEFKEQDITGTIILRDRDEPFPLSVNIIGMVSSYRDLINVRTVDELLGEIDRRNKI